MEGEIIRPSILREIDDKKRLVKEGTIESDLGREILCTLAQDAAYHSGLLEGEKRKPRKERIARKKATSDTSFHLLGAWEAGLHTYKKEGLTHRLLTQIASKASGIEFQGYRDVAVRVTGEDAVQPPRAEKVRLQMDTLLDLVNGADYHLVERAALFHLHAARIHPFGDGNGRMARMGQNLLLFNHGYGPVNISIGEREFYQGLLREALKGYRVLESEGFQFGEFIDEPSKQERRFFDYIGSKVNASMDHMVDELAQLPHYVVNLRGNNPGETIALKKVLRAYFERRGVLGQVRLEKNGGDGHMEVKGDITEETLDKIVRGRYRGKYEVGSK